MARKQTESNTLLLSKKLGIRVFECTSIQRQFKEKIGSECNSNSIIVGNYNINNKNNDNNDNTT